MAGGHAIEIGVLGPLRVRVDGRDISDLPMQFRALLVALALAEQPVAKTSLARDVLYISPATLDSRLSRLARALELTRPLQRVPVARSGLIELDSRIAITDAIEFRRLIADAGDSMRSDRSSAALTDLLAAAALWRGRPGEGSKIGVATDDPMHHAVVALGALHRRLIADAARLMLDTGRFERDILDRWTTADPEIAEPWFARIVDAVDRRDERGARALLDRWAIAAPNPAAESATFRWAGHLVANARRAHPVAALPTPAPAVGREAAVSNLTTLVARLPTGGTFAAAVTGPAGAGKTHLLAHLAGVADADGVRVVAVDVERRLGFQHALRALVGDLWSGLLRRPDPPADLLEVADDLAALLDDDHESAPRGREPVDPVTDAARLVVALLGHAAAHRPLLLALDNVHRARPELEAALAHIADRGLPGVGILATTRDDGERDAAGSDGLGCRGARPWHIEPLPAFDAVAAARFLGQARGIVPSLSAISSLVGPEGTTPLVLLGTDLCNTATRPTDPSVGDPMRRAFLARPAASQRVLMAAAVAAEGVAFDPSLVVAIDTSPAATATLATELRHGRIIAEVSGGSTFVHRAWQELAHSMLDPHERRLLHRRALEVLDDRLARSDDRSDKATLAMQVAEHAQHADFVGLARPTALRAVTRAIDALGPFEARRAGDLYDLAFAVAEPTARAELLIRRGQLRRQSADWDGAQRDLSEAADLAARSGDYTLEAEALLLIAHVTWDPASLDGSLAQRLASLLARLPDDEALLTMRVRACLAGGTYQDGATGPIDGASDLARSALTELERRGAPSGIEAEILWWARKGLLDVEPPARTLALSRRLLAVAGDSSYHRGNALLACVVDRLLLGRPAAARRDSEAYLALARRTRSPVHEYVAATLSGLWALYEGRFDDVERSTEQAARTGSGFGGLTVAQVVQGQRTCWGRDTGVFRRMPELTALVDDFAARESRIPIWTVASAWVRSDAGDSTVAIERLQEVGAATRGFAAIAAGPHRLPLLAMAAESLADVTALGAAENDALARLADRVADHLRADAGRGVLIGWPVAYLGTTRRYLGLAEVAAGRPRVALDLLRRARRADRASAPLTARTDLAIARVHLALNEVDQARRAARSAVRRASLLGMVGVHDDAAALAASPEPIRRTARGHSSTVDSSIIE